MSVEVTQPEAGAGFGHGRGAGVLVQQHLWAVVGSEV
jgi:hypothetical protein